MTEDETPRLRLLLGLAGRVDGAADPIDHRAMSDELDPPEAERARRRDREAAAKQRALMRPGMGKVFKQIRDAQVKAAKTAPKRRRPRAG
jgi:hypothetical protein